MVFGYNKVIYPGYGGSSDVRMNLQDYYEFSTCLRQDDLNNKMLLRFKNAYMVNAYAGLAILTVSFIPGVIGSRLICGPVNRSHANYKLLFPVFMGLYGLTAWQLTFKEIPRRLYTEILADETVEGAYVRKTLRETKPNLWSHLSRQLYSLGYRLPEMNEVNNDEFPTALME